ncbi:carbohydrate ABC transporter permease [Paenibacillus thalictri]|uniref:Carbohydrate ABC transporter permease n=1 Tax=Paenibacillus thalictri TaxID=2527873 RepID=A0A4Q9DVS8_9BACL|nr:carbohydrate ABC transporter permease [Paenibacillus thalictri]TBL81129.1 carbohydrate ABC transporter permease [Paenibacillus thalictri]
MKAVKRIEHVLIYIVLAATSLLILYPIALILVSSMKTSPEFMSNPFGWPQHWTFSNYTMAWETASFSTYFGNSILLTSVSVIFIVLFGSMTAYALNWNFKGSKQLFSYFLLGIMIPLQAKIITLFVFMKQLGIINTHFGLILVFIAFNLSLAIFIFFGFFKTIPKELKEAALLDGCSEIGTFWRIILPVSRPIIATVIILTGLYVWNSFFLPLILLQDKKLFPITLGLQRLKGEISVNWPLFFAAMVMLMIPIITVFVIMQKQFIKGLTNGAVKG